MERLCVFLMDGGDVRRIDWMSVRIDVVGGHIGHQVRTNRARPAMEDGYIAVGDGTGDIVLHIDDAVGSKAARTDRRPHFAALAESPCFGQVQTVMARLRKDPAPLLARYRRIYVCDPQLAALHPRIECVSYVRSWIKEPALYPKTKLVSMISSNKALGTGHRRRLVFAQQLKDRLDLFGRGINDIAQKEDGLRDYMFSVAIENIQWPGYHTEKIIDCFMTGTVPIYYGDPMIGRRFNTRGIIVLSSNTPTPTPAMYRKMLPAVRDNYERAMKHKTGCYIECLWMNHLSRVPSITKMLAAKRMARKDREAEQEESEGLVAGGGP